MRSARLIAALAAVTAVLAVRVAPGSADPATVTALSPSHVPSFSPWNVSIASTEPVTGGTITINGATVAHVTGTGAYAVTPKHAWAPGVTYRYTVTTQDAAGLDNEVSGSFSGASVDIRQFDRLDQTHRAKLVVGYMTETADDVCAEGDATPVTLASGLTKSIIALAHPGLDAGIHRTIRAADRIGPLIRTFEGQLNCWSPAEVTAAKRTITQAINDEIGGVTASLPGEDQVKLRHLLTNYVNCAMAVIEPNATPEEAFSDTWAGAARLQKLVEARCQKPLEKGAEGLVSGS